MKQSTGRPPRSPAAGYTLLELMIVLVILSVLAAVSWPQLRRPLSRSRLQDSAQQLAKVLTGVRLQAMAEGRTYAFRYQAGAATFHWCPAEWLLKDPQQSGAGTLSVDAQPEPAADSSAGNYFVPDQQQTEPGDPLRESDVLGGSDPQALGDALGDDNPLGHLESLPSGTRFADSQPDADSHALDLSLDSTDALVESVAVNPPDEMAQARSAGDLDSTLWSLPLLFYPDGRGTNALLVLTADEGYEVDVRVRGLTGTVRIETLRRTETPLWEQEVPQEKQDAPSPNQPPEPENQPAPLVPDPLSR